MSGTKIVRGFYFYPTDRVSLSMLSDADRGRLLLSLFDYYDGVDTSESLSPQSQMAFAFLSARITERHNAAHRRSDINRTNAEKRWSVREVAVQAASEEDG